MRTLKTILRNPGAALGLLGVIVFVLIGITAPFLSPFDPNKQNLRATFRPPSREHLFGTDQSGRDILSRVLWGARTSLIVATSAIALALVVGALTGVSVGYWGGWADEAVMRFVDILLTFPDIFLAIIVTAVVPPGLGTTVLAIAVYNLPQFVRVARAAALSVRENGARGGGQGKRGLLPLHHHPPRPPQLPRPHRGPGHPQDRRFHPHRRWTKLPRPWGTAAHTGVGNDDQRDPRLHRHRALDQPLSRPGHLPHRPFFQPPRRRNKRCPEPKKEGFPG